MSSLGDDEELAEQCSEDSALCTGCAECGGAIHQDAQIGGTGLVALADWGGVASGQPDLAIGPGRSCLRAPRPMRGP